MNSPQTFWRNSPPVVRALAAQGAAFLPIAALAWFMAPHTPFWFWPLFQGLLAAVLALFWGLNRWWLLFQILLPSALAWELGHTVPVWIYPFLLFLLFMVFGGGILTRVPLYNSSHSAWKALESVLPKESGYQMADLGAGLGGPLAYLARQRPDLRFTGIEASPLVWICAWLRTWPVRARCRITFGSLWKIPLQDYRVVYAFLSPAPMEELWAKVQREMKPGSMLISNTFFVPGVLPDLEIPLPDRSDARLLVYRIETGG